MALVTQTQGETLRWRRSWAFNILTAPLTLNLRSFPGLKNQEKTWKKLRGLGAKWEDHRSGTLRALQRPLDIDTEDVWQRTARADRTVWLQLVYNHSSRILKPVITLITQTQRVIPLLKLS